jgi:hypothetical protein
MELSAMETDFVQVVTGFITKNNLTITNLLPALAMMHDVLGTFEQVTKESSSTPLALWPSQRRAANHSANCGPNDGTNCSSNSGSNVSTHCGPLDGTNQSANSGSNVSTHRGPYDGTNQSANSGSNVSTHRGPNCGPLEGTNQSAINLQNMKKIQAMQQLVVCIGNGKRTKSMQNVTI